MSLTAARPADAVLDLPTRITIHYKARHLIGRYGFTISDLPDLEQDLSLDLLRRAGGYDPARAQWQTFVARCIDHRIADLIRSRCCLMRHHERRAVLDSSDDKSPAHGEHSHDALVLHDLRLDVAAVLGRLPERLRDLGHRLMATTVSEIAAEDGCSRWRVYRDIADIRAAFQAAGLTATY
jgi:RNA polymerase sigma-70 factor, ECF subfamily